MMAKGGGESLNQDDPDWGASGTTVKYGYLNQFGPSKFDAKIHLMQISV